VTVHIIPDTSRPEVGRASSRRGLRIGMKFAVVLALLVPSLLIVGWVGLSAQRRATDVTREMYAENVVEAQLTARAQTAVTNAGLAALRLAAEPDPARRAHLQDLLYGRLIPDGNGVIAKLPISLGSDDAPQAEQLVADWADFTATVASLAAGAPPAGGATARSADELARRVQAALSSVTTTLSTIQSDHEARGNAALRQVEHEASQTKREILAIVAIALLAGVGGVLILIRDLVPRLRSYSAFARNVAAGELSGRLHPQGADELSDLGVVLDELVARRSAERDYERAQAALNEAMQVTSGEEEAHQLLKRHLELNATGATATVLIRNNSANRLQPTTSLSDAPELVERLRNAQPRACLAVRLGRPHDGLQGGDALLSCGVCGDRDSEVRTRCQPLLVGGEVIGSVLVQQQEQSERDRRCISDSVTIAAPILANLRNLALAEHRALNDALTGLPNQRACHDTIRRMIAQASRSVAPLAAILLDLDHFKQINDLYGHDRGDEVLAAVGAVLGSSMRSSDFAGRLGGEEFLILLADTGRDGAVRAAEKARAAVGNIKIAAIDRKISASLGIAVMPDHAVDAEGLLRQADRALYSAKAAGRDQTMVVAGNDSVQAVDPASVEADAKTADGEPDGQEADDVVDSLS
jgi:diguanylate cyclase (GGDEF)-like protein